MDGKIGGRFGGITLNSASEMRGSPAGKLHYVDKEMAETLDRTVKDEPKIANSFQESEIFAYHVLSEEYSAQIFHLVQEIANRLEPILLPESPQNGLKNDIQAPITEVGRLMASSVIRQQDLVIWLISLRNRISI